MQGVQVRRFLGVLILGALAGPRASCLYADYATTVRPDTCWGTWQGWGCSLGWWAKEFGNRNDLADLLFTMGYTTLNGQSLPGLGLTIARYNAGACSWNSIQGLSMVESDNIALYRQMEGYWLDWYSSDPSSSSWDWSVDARQRAMLGKARDRGATHFELFSNSPMWWMCYNHNPSGADAGGNDNLQSWNYRNHAIYLATVARYFHDEWQLDFTSVAPFNEPIADWWHAQGTQEGCHFDRTTQATVIRYLWEELDSRQLGAAAVAASDESWYSMALDTWNSFDPTVRSCIAQVNVHGYEYGSGPRRGLYFALGARTLWNSEYGDEDASGLSLAANLHRDLHQLHPTAWCYWQPFDWSGWGLVPSNLGDHWIGNANPKYFVLAHYSRHIRPGMLILATDNENTVAAYDAAARKLVLVTVNYQTPQWITHDLSRFGQAAGLVTRWQTLTDAGPRYQQFTDIVLTGGSFGKWFNANSIETFEIQNVDPPSSAIGSIPRPGLWYAILARHSGKCLEVAGGPTATGNGTTVQQWDYHGQHNQQWRLEPAADGYYRLTPRHARGKCLDVSEASTDAGADVIQWDYTGGANQQWRLLAGEDGHFALVARHSDMCADVNGVSTANGANVLQWIPAGDNNQLWAFELVQPQCLLTPAQGDLNEDCMVDLRDFALAGRYWLWPCAATPYAEFLGEDCRLDLVLLARMADNWLACGWIPGD
ncbi:MAG: RICIN domain-containing protein [Sedimentisphaerales bacterium]|nr:RICIN domain-containing protein [Sedimentisphaerales bacterium]